LFFSIVKKRYRSAITAGSEQTGRGRAAIAWGRMRFSRSSETKIYFFERQIMTVRAGA